MRERYLRNTHKSSIGGGDTRRAYHAKTVIFEYRYIFLLLLLLLGLLLLLLKCMLRVPVAQIRASRTIVQTNTHVSCEYAARVHYMPI